jgi:hypothetical protein
MQVGAMVLLYAILASGCGSKITQENFEKIQYGMTEAEVRGILGNATESSSITLGPVGGTSSTWEEKGRTITIQFVNGKVFAKVFSGKKP